MESDKDIVVEARELLRDITPGKWGYDLNGRIAVIEDDREWGLTLFQVPGKTTPQLTAEDHANGKFIEAAPRLLRALADEVEQMRELIVHMHVHSGYRDNGYMQMTTPQKTMYDAIWRRSVEELDAEDDSHHANS